MSHLLRALFLIAGFLHAVVATSAMAESRLEVARITREPHLPPPNRPNAPRGEGWPEPGDRIEWIAHVLNRGAQGVSDVAYTWRIDGEIVADGRVELPRGETTVVLPWRWRLVRERITFEITPSAGLGDATVTDDRVTVDSDALSIGFRIEQGLYDWMAEGGRPGFERWAQGQIEIWHRIFARAVFATAPEGALDRMRLDRVLVVPDGAPSRAGELDTDLAWYFRTEPSQFGFLYKGAPDAVVADQTIVLHEMLHGRGLVDLYAYIVVHGDEPRTDSFIDIREGGMLVAGSALMPSLTGPGSPWYTLFLPNINGVMGSSYRASANLTEHCVNGLNRLAGRRTPLWFDQWGNQINGFTNADQPDSYARAMPERTDLLIVDQTGGPVANAEINVHADTSPHTYQKRYRPVPDRTLRTDANGVVSLAQGLLAGPSPSGPPKATVLILGVSTSTSRGYLFLPAWELNLAAFRDPVRGTLTKSVKLIPR